MRNMNLFLVIIITRSGFIVCFSPLTYVCWKRSTQTQIRKSSICCQSFPQQRRLRNFGASCSINGGDWTTTDVSLNDDTFFLFQFLLPIFLGFFLPLLLLLLLLLQTNIFVCFLNQGTTIDTQPVIDRGKTLKEQV